MPAQPTNHAYVVPSQEGPASEPSNTPEVSGATPRPIVPGEGLQAYQERTRELSEEASRYALSNLISPTPLYDQLVREQKPEFARIPSEVEELAQVTELIALTRKNSITELYKQTGPARRMFRNIEEKLAKEEAIMAAKFLLDVPKGEEWKLYPSEGDWFIEKARVSGAIGFVHPPYLVVHFERDDRSPTGMSKSKARAGEPYLSYHTVELGELQDLLGWAKKYYLNILQLPEQMLGESKKTPKHRQFN